MKKLIPTLLALTFVLQGCVKDLNLDPELGINYPGNWAVPLVNTRISLGDLVAEDSLAYADDDHLVHIVYRMDSAYSQDVKEFAKVAIQDPIFTSYSAGTPPLDVSSHLNTLGGAQLENISVETALLNYKITNPASGTATMQLTIKHATINGAPAVLSIPISANSTSTGQLNIGGLHLDLTNGSPAYNNLAFEIGLDTNSTVPNGTQLDLELQFSNLEIDQATGYFGQREIQIPSNQFNTNLGILGNIAQGLYLANPQLKLYTTTSNIGLPVKLSPNLLGVSKQQNVVGLNLDPITFVGATQPGVIVTDSIIISNSNSDLSDFIANVPENIILSGKVELNPQDSSFTSNFIDNDSELLLGLEIDLPLELSTKNVTIEQTIYNIDFGIEQEDYDYVENLSLGFKAENGFPLDADLHVYFEDSTGTILDSVEVQIFDAAQVDSDGYVTNPAVSQREYEFTYPQITEILKSKNIRLKVILNTTNSGQQNVRMLTDYYIDMVVGAQTKVNFEL